MKCEKCFALKTEGYEYPETYCGAGVPEDKLHEFADGSVGCRYSGKRIHKRMERIERMQDRQYDGLIEYYQESDALDRAMEKAVKEALQEIPWGDHAICCRETSEDPWHEYKPESDSLSFYIRTKYEELEEKHQADMCWKCEWNGRRPQKCACCKRNRSMKDNFRQIREEDDGMGEA